MSVDPAVDIAVISARHGMTDLTEGFRDSLGRAGLTVAYEEQDQGSYAGLNWALPTLVVLFLSRKLLDSFLTEAGKDLYRLFKAELERLVATTTGPSAAYHVTLVSSTQSPHKSRNPYPPIVSIYASLADGCRARFFFTQDLDRAAYQAAIDAMLDALLEYQVDSTCGLLAGIGKTSEVVLWGVVPLVFEPQAGAWRTLRRSEVEDAVT